MIGRKSEIQTLKKILKSNKAELVVLYGRRRVGKTYLIREFFKSENCTFLQTTGLQDGKLKNQLRHFADAVSQTFMHGIEIKTPSSWDDCFRTLNQLINTSENKKRTVIFMDEVPWMATRKSGFLEALDYYWNHYWSANSNIVLIICGSSASWLIKNIIYNKGGLHNRCTCEIQLDPFNLLETSEFLNTKKIKYTKRQVLEIYMAIGGIPYYLNYIEKGKSASENIQDIFFEKHSPLKDEFKKLFSSLFTDAKSYIELVKLIANKKEGVSRVEIEKLAKLSPGGGRLTQRLDDLVRTKMIEAYIPWDKKKGEYYKVVDEFTLFYLYWLSEKNKFVASYWLNQIKKPKYAVWAGYAFEAVCYKHIDKIINCLNIKKAETISSWRVKTQDKNILGAQIDLLIDRSDDAITLCEVKYTDHPFIITKSYAESLKRKMTSFISSTRTKKQIFLALISANGLKKNGYSEELVNNEVTLDDLF